MSQRDRLIMSTNMSLPRENRES